MEDTLAKFSAVLDGDLTGHSGPPVCIDLAEDATPKILGCRVALRDVDLGVDNDLGDCDDPEYTEKPPGKARETEFTELPFVQNGSSCLNGLHR
ncbi:hypothetical protein HPB52_025019 [Rhipicephalus sanguineus]|uniref:Uncharacterized protein n=1 Tax=Rhipicephalus sanguineus TaxID=34632 RepID=A0A9D4TDL6_RHISA|nr:hypothetical protein HPB52_025019 [Rhipicephalus sanguineus]